jgi:hypothetical protein
MARPTQEIITMELKDFIAQTISQIMEGVKESQELAHQSGGAVNPKGQMYLVEDAAPFMDKGTTRIGDFMHFDVAVEVTEGKAKSGGAKISVPTIGGLGGELNEETRNKSISRVSFRIPVIFPKSKYEEGQAVAYPLHRSIDSGRDPGLDSSACITTAPVSVQRPPANEGEEG